MTLHVKRKKLCGSEGWEPYINQDDEKWDANPIEKEVNRSISTLMLRGELGKHLANRNENIRVGGELFCFRG